MNRFNLNVRWVIATAWLSLWGGSWIAPRPGWAIELPSKCASLQGAFEIAHEGDSLVDLFSRYRLHLMFSSDRQGFEYETDWRNDMSGIVDARYFVVEDRPQSGTCCSAGLMACLETIQKVQEKLTFARAHLTPKANSPDEVQALDCAIAWVDLFVARASAEFPLSRFE